VPAIASPGFFRRIGGALRIYLNRGCYSSGEGELLGVVVATDKMPQCGSSEYRAWLGPRQQDHSHLLTIFGTASGSNAIGTRTTFQVVVEVHHDGGWLSDADTTIASRGAACSPQAHYEDGTGNPQPRLDSYVLTVTKHHCRHRRVTVREYEMRTTYDPVILNDTSPLLYLVNTSQPIELPHS
jgi:hypothetical protein